VIFYADTITDSIKRTMEVVAYRREKQLAYNRERGITPRSVQRAAQASLHVYDGSGERAGQSEEARLLAVAEGMEDRAAVIAELENEMLAASRKLEFERAAVIRDQIDALRSGKGLQPDTARGSFKRKGMSTTKIKSAKRK